MICNFCGLPQHPLPHGRGSFVTHVPGRTWMLINTATRRTQAVREGMLEDDLTKILFAVEILVKLTADKGVVGQLAVPVTPQIYPARLEGGGLCNLVRLFMKPSHGAIEVR